MDRWPSHPGQHLTHQEDRARLPDRVKAFGGSWNQWARKNVRNKLCIAYLVRPQDHDMIVDRMNESNIVSTRR